MAVTLDALRGPECRRCGRSIEHLRSDAQFCSVKCYNDDYHQLDKDARLAARALRAPCCVCGEALPFAAPWKRLYCSYRCQREAGYRQRRARLKKTCVECGEPFDTTHASQRFCSQRCNGASRGKRPTSFQLDGSAVVPPKQAKRTHRNRCVTNA